MNHLINSMKYRWMSFKIRHFDTEDRALRRKFYQEYYNIEIGKHTYGEELNNIARGTKIGAFCSLASGVKIGLMEHPLHWVSSNPFLYYASRGFVKEDVNYKFKVGSVIENDVWIGTNAIIMPGVHVGNGAVIGAGAVVTKDVLSYQIVVGSPARHLKWRFEDPEIREKLDQIRWWEWPDRVIKDNIQWFYNPELFVEEAGKIREGKSGLWRN